LASSHDKSKSKKEKTQKSIGFLHEKGREGFLRGKKQERKKIKSTFSTPTPKKGNEGINWEYLGNNNNPSDKKLAIRSHGQIMSVGMEVQSLSK
jgi:hypothetical protein